MPLVAGQVASATGLGTSIAVAFPSNVTAGNLLIYATNAAAAYSSVTDTRNTPVLAIGRNHAGASVFTAIHYVENCLGGATTATRNHASTNAGICVAEYDTITTAGGALDKTASAEAFSTSASSGATATTAQADELLIGFTGAENGTATATGGFTEDVEFAGPRPGQLESKTVAATGAYTATATMSADTNWATLIATFKLIPPTVALTGTATAAITEADIVAGGKTVILTATGDTYVPNSIVPPVIETADCTVSGNNTAQATWVVSHPAASTGDLLIFYVAWDDSTTTTDVTEPAGPNGETLTELNATPVTDGLTETRAKAWYTVATGSWSASTVTFTPTATESWSATVVRVPAGEFEAATPMGAVGTSADAGGGTDTTVDSPAFSAGASDGDGTLLWFAGVDADPLSATPPTNWTILQAQDLGAVAHGVAKRTAAVTDSESIASATWTIAGDSWTSIAVIVRAPTVAAFESARAAIISGLDSAQAESAGWDAKVKANIPVGNVVRTSATVVTVTLQAQSDYNITATETITATIPATALSGGSAIVATPTFTIGTAAGAAFVARPTRPILQAVARSSYW